MLQGFKQCNEGLEPYVSIHEFHKRNSFKQCNEGLEPSDYKCIDCSSALF